MQDIITGGVAERTKFGSLFQAAALKSREARPGDWICKGCGDLQFKKNPICRKCGIEKSKIPWGPDISAETGAVNSYTRTSSSTTASTGIARPIEDGVVEQPRKKTKWDYDQTPAVATQVGPSGPREFQIPDGLVLKGDTFVKLASTRELKMPKHMKGGLIGKNGENINKIQEESGCTIKLLPIEDEPDNVIVSVRGKPHDVEGAFKIIEDRIKQMTAPGYKWEMKIIEVPKALIGETIGPGGCNLHRMAAESDCKMKFLQATEVDETAQPGKQVCVIRGAPEKILVAESLLAARVEEVQAIHMKKLTATGTKQQIPQDGWNYASNDSRGQSGYSDGHSQSKVPCKFHMARPGSCKNGAQCYFSHDPEVIAAAQGVTFSSEADESSPDYKTLYCKFFDSGKCTRGEACIYAHGVHELRGGLTPKNEQLMQEAWKIAELDKQHKEERRLWQSASNDWHNWQDDSSWGSSGTWGQTQESQVPAAFRPRQKPIESPLQVPAAFRAAVPAAFKTASFQSKKKAGTGQTARSILAPSKPVLAPMTTEMQFY